LGYSTRDPSDFCSSRYRSRRCAKYRAPTQLRQGHHLQQGILSKFPDAGAACIEAKTANGKRWIRFNAEVKRKEGDHLTVEFLDKDEKGVTPMVFAFDPNATLMLEDKSVKAAAAAEEGDKIMIWVPETRFDLYAKPGASQSEHFTLVSNGQPQER